MVGVSESDGLTWFIKKSKNEVDDLIESWAAHESRGEGQNMLEKAQEIVSHFANDSDTRVNNQHDGSEDFANPEDEYDSDEDELLDRTVEEANDTAALLSAASPLSLPVDKTGSKDWPIPLRAELGEIPQDSAEMMTIIEKDSEVRVFCCTWNLAGSLPSSDEVDRVIPLNENHIYAIATQECERSIAKSAMMTSKKAWENKLATRLGPNYALLRSHTLQAIHIAVFVRHELLKFVSNLGSSAVATGYKDTLGNKGAAGVCFNLGRTSFMFLSAHLEAHQNATQQRNDHFHKIDTQMALPPGFKVRKLPRRQSSSKLSGTSVDPSEGKDKVVPASGYDMAQRADASKRVSCRFERVFWLGDLNYRVDAPRSDVDLLIAESSSISHAALISTEQLSSQFAAETVFAGFEEGPLNFLPTYKFDKAATSYDSSKKQRIPSWTDRILHRSSDPSAIKLLHYDSVCDATCSDHRPVLSKYKVGIEGFDDPTLVAVQQNEVGKAESQVCRVM